MDEPVELKSNWTWPPTEAALLFLGGLPRLQQTKAADYSSLGSPNHCSPNHFRHHDQREAGSAKFSELPLLLWRPAARGFHVGGCKPVIRRAKQRVFDYAFPGAFAPSLAGSTP
jgi:hypothetical protein